MNRASTCFFSIVLTATAALVSACGGQTAGSGGGGSGSGTGGSGTGGTAGTAGAGGTTSSGPTPQEACAALEKARCTRDDACTNDLSSVTRFGDQATCEARLELGCVAALAAEGTSQTPETITTCAAAIGAESCTDYLDGQVVDACVPKPGALADGKACAFNGQCQSTFCKVDPGAACGACAALPKAGDACLDAGQCGRDLLCVKAAGATAGTCAAPVAEGGMCDKSASACGAGLSCVGAMAAGQGTCTAEGSKVGDACDAKKKDAPGCNRNLGLYCPVGTGMTCQAAKPAAAGAACGIVGADVLYCTAGAVCIKPQGAAQGICTSPDADGTGCDTSAGPPCLAPAKCVLTNAAGTAGKCQLPDASVCK